MINQLKIEFRYNTKFHIIEIRNGPQTNDVRALQKANDFFDAYMKGFRLEDSLALIQLDDIFLTSFDILQVRQVLHDNSLSRAIGRIAGHRGSTKLRVEQLTDTRIVLAGHKVHLMGPQKNITIATSAISRLVLGTPAEKVLTNLKKVMSHHKSSL